MDKKQFYRAVVAIASHPLVDGGEKDTNFGNTNSLHGTVEGGEAENGDGPIERTGPFGRFINCNLFNRASPMFHRIRPVYQQIRQRIIHPLMNGSLSGLPLLVLIL